ncbi:MAG: hypothetical protein A2Y38_18545 [Spirochaetes bacterium GWB1_59_5]|nr:MAG: hypothetical protein A2Y38_18545 [Spirochaetes bacterium GWB1_59_5]
MANQVTNSRYFKRYAFEGTSLPADWAIAAQGTGMAVAVAGGALTITTGTTALAVTKVRCSKAMQPRCRVRFVAKLSQRIVNQTFYLEVVDASGTTYAHYKFDGATATACLVNSAYAGVANAAKSPGTAPTSAASFLADIRLDMDRAIFSMIAADSVASMSPSTHFDKNVPANETELFIEIRAENGASVPASTTTLTIESVMISDIENLSVEVVPGQAISNPATAVPVIAATTIPISGSVTNTPLTPTASTIVSAASTNAQFIKAAAGTIFSINVSNEHTAAQYLKIYNKATAPTVGTDQPVLTIPLPASSRIEVNFGAIGMRLSAGIAVAITALMPYTDTGVATVNAVRVCTAYA